MTARTPTQSPEGVAARPADLSREGQVEPRQRETDDDDISGFLDGKVLLRQPRSGHHRAGTDAALLVAAALPYARGRIVDLGAGVGTIGIALAALSQAVTSALLVEIDARLTALALANAALNAVADRVAVCTADIGAWRADPIGEPETAALVIANPPFHDPTRTRASPSDSRKLAHSLPDADFATWIGTATRLLRRGGRLIIIHRPDALATVLAQLARGYGSVRIRSVHARDTSPALRVLISARKGGRAPLALEAPIVLHGEGSGFTPLAERVHRGEATLPFSA